MSTTYNFEELDDTTHDYLVAVRDSEGLGSPGVFASTSDSLPGCGCIMGPIVIAVTLMFTLTTWLGVIYNHPAQVALLQVGGLLLGGWLLFAKFRSSRGTNKIAGTWVYVDPLFLYEAYREQVTVTPIDDVDEAKFTHNYNNGNYQNSVVHIALSGNHVVAVTLTSEARAEQMVVYLNYIAWARGPEGGERANLPPATLGGLAKYVAKNDQEPLDAESNINLNLIELDITEIPEEPTRAGRATPAVFPYLIMLVIAGGLFFFLAFVVNPPLRDDAVFARCTEQPMEPRVLRGYFVAEPALTRHREEVLDKLSAFYSIPIDHVKRSARDPILRNGMVAVLESMRTAEQPVASIQVTEAGLPDAGSKEQREDWVREEFAKGVNEVFGQIQPAINPPPDMQFKEPPPPIGHQLIAFVKKEPDMPEALFDIRYTYTRVDGGYAVSVKVTIRTEADKPAVAVREFDVPGVFAASEAGRSGGAAHAAIKLALVDNLVGKFGNPGVNPIPPGGIQPGGF